MGIHPQLTDDADYLVRHTSCADTQGHMVSLDPEMQPHGEKRTTEEGREKGTAVSYNHLTLLVFG